MSFVQKYLSLLITTSVLSGLLVSPIAALERRLTEDIPAEELVKETMQFKEIGENKLLLMWYVPMEAMGAPAQNGLLIAVAKAEISPDGIFDFASENELERGLTVTYMNSETSRPQILKLTSINADLTQFIALIKPMISRIAGDIGQGMHFFVYGNVNASGQKIVSPYNPGRLEVSLSIGTTQRATSTLDLPLNSLFVPRLCPNGKPAHISWKYCPWDGTPLR